MPLLRDDKRDGYSCNSAQRMDTCTRESYDQQRSTAQSRGLAHAVSAKNALLDGEVNWGGTLGTVLAGGRTPDLIWRSLKTRMCPSLPWLLLPDAEASSWGGRNGKCTRLDIFTDNLGVLARLPRTDQRARAPLRPCPARARRLDIRDGFFSNPLLFGTGVINSRTVARACVVALAVAHSRIVNLEKEFEQHPVAHDIRVKHDLNRFRMRAVVAIGRVRDVATAIAHAR